MGVRIEAQHLDAQHVAASLHQLPGGVQVVIQGVLAPSRVCQVPRVADGSLHPPPTCGKTSRVTMTVSYQAVYDEV